MKKFKSSVSYFLIYSAALIYFELVLSVLVKGGIERSFLYFLCFIPAEALALTALSGFFRKDGNIVISYILLLLLEVYYIGQLIYFKIFGTLIPAFLVGVGEETMKGIGGAMKDVLADNLGGVLLLVMPAFIAAALSVFGVLKQEKIRILPRLAAIALVIPAWILGVQVTRLDGSDIQSAYKVYNNSLSDTDTSASHLGAAATTVLELVSYRTGSGTSDEEALLKADPDSLPEPEPEPEPEQPAEVSPEPEEEKFTPVPHIYEEIDLKSLEEMEQDKKKSKLKGVAEFLEQRGPTYTNEYTGMFKGYNLIYICAEAFWSGAVNEKATPTLYKMANNGIVLTNYYNSFKNTTTNGEFAFATSLWPDLSITADCGRGTGSFPQSANCYMPFGLGNMFATEGVPSFGFHNYKGNYYRRSSSWPNLGYVCKFSGAGMKFTTAWPASDYELMQQSVDDYIYKDRFHAYYMTFSGHGPYNSNNPMYNRNIKQVKSVVDKGLTADAIGYLACNKELDKGMEYLLQRLEEAGQLEKTVIVITGDHYPYYLSAGGANSLAGHKLDTNFEKYKSTCIIYNAGMEESIVTDTYCSNVDIVPTMLNLFGIQFDSRLLMGRDIFAEDTVHKAVLFNKSFITDLVKYNKSTGKAEWTEKANDMTDEMKKEYLDTIKWLVDAEYGTSLTIISQDYYKHVWENSGLFNTDINLQ